jgi:hypothetical protein
VQVEIRDGLWRLTNNDVDLWSAPASPDVWVRFALDMFSSKDAALGSVKLYVDLDGDGDSTDPKERTETFSGPTLKTQLEGATEDGLPAGAAVAAHLRLGTNHDPAMTCPSPVGCFTDIDNVQVIRLAPGAPAQ